MLELHEILLLVTIAKRVEPDLQTVQDIVTILILEVTHVTIWQGPTLTAMVQSIELTVEVQHDLLEVLVDQIILIIEAPIEREVHTAVVVAPVEVRSSLPVVV